MLVIILGGTGFIGKALSRELHDYGHEIAVFSRSAAKVRSIFGDDVRALETGGGPASWCDLLGPETAIVNLAGENIATRWNSQTMRRILESRVRAGEEVAEAVRLAPSKPAIVIQGSAVGFYGPQPGDVELDETAPSGEGFLAEVCRKWEASSASVQEHGVPRAVVRTGVVLGAGGALAKMVPPFRFYAGGPVGDGRQVLSWIHLADEVGAIRFLIEQKLSGIYNLTAPAPATSREFSRELGRALGRPALLPTLSFVLRLLFGQMADEALLSGQRVMPKALQDAGYAFRFPVLAEALADAVQGL